MPNAVSFCNVLDSSEMTRATSFPDVDVVDRLSPFLSDEDPEPRLAMAAGEFVDIFTRPSELGRHDGVVTCFFLDTAKNVFSYVRTIAGMLREGGVWANLGPLLFHFADSPDEMSIEVSWDQLRPAIEEYFELVEVHVPKLDGSSEQWKYDCKYTSSSSMMRVLYHCIVFFGKRNSKPVEGYSSDVYAPPQE